MSVAVRPPHPPRPADPVFAPYGSDGITYLALGNEPGRFAGSDGSLWRPNRRRGRGADRSLPSGYPIPWKQTVALLGGGRRWYLMVRWDHRHVLAHNVIAEAFLGPCPRGIVCRHLDDDGLNNRIENLAYGTQTQNFEDRAVNTAHLGRDPRRWGPGKLTAGDKDEIRSAVGRGVSRRILADRFGVSVTSISNVLAPQHRSLLP